MGNDKDTHGFVVSDNNIVIQDRFFQGSKDISESVKVSNLKNVTLRNCIIDPSREDCLDIVRGDTLICENVTFNSAGALQAITCKGGFQRLILDGCKFRGDPENGEIILGQYSDYNYHKDLRVKYTEIKRCVKIGGGFIKVQLWNADNPQVENSTVEVKRIHPIIVKAYFTFRKIQQFLFERDRVKASKKAL